MSTESHFREIHESCHRGNICITFDWSEIGCSIPVRAYRCDLCSKHMAVWTSYPRGYFKLTNEQIGDVSRYRFGTKITDYLICGVMPTVTCLIEATRYRAVNVNTFDNVNPPGLAEAATDFESEAVDTHLSIRKRNCTPKIVDIAA